MPRVLMGFGFLLLAGSFYLQPDRLTAWGFGFGAGLLVAMVIHVAVERWP